MITGESKAVEDLTEKLEEFEIDGSFNGKTYCKVPDSILFVMKHGDDSLKVLLRELLGWLLKEFPRITLYIEKSLENSSELDLADLKSEHESCHERVKFWSEEEVNQDSQTIDLIVTLGGDGTVLFASNMFQKKVPPVLCFALGSLGFLTTFQFENYKQNLFDILNNKYKVNYRTRLYCQVFRKKPFKIDEKTGKKICCDELVQDHHILNELTIDRGSSPYLSNLELYGNDTLFTVAQGDGLIIATPTGSTAYSLSAGGSLVYPSVEALLVTPICPNSLSFRPIILPNTIKFEVRVPMKSRDTAWASFDGKKLHQLFQGDYIKVTVSPYPFPTYESSTTQYIDSIRRTLNWNLRDSQKSLSHVLTPKNKEKYEYAKSCKKSAEEEEEEKEKEEKDMETTGKN